MALHINPSAIRYDYSVEDIERDYAEARQGTQTSLRGVYTIASLCARVITEDDHGQGLTVRYPEDDEMIIELYLHPLGIGNPLAIRTPGIPVEDGPFSECETFADAAQILIDIAEKSRTDMLMALLD